jgi:phosphoglycerate dehydrogenase-like enzyme
LTWALILALVRHVPQEDRATRSGQWQVSVGEGLNGKVLGVIGLGNLGSQVATIGKAFGMSLLAWSQHLTAERAAQYGATLVSKNELLSQSDIVTIHLVLSARTRGLIGARELGLMQRTAYLINLSKSKRSSRHCNRGQLPVRVWTSLTKSRCHSTIPSASWRTR